MKDMLQLLTLSPKLLNFSVCDSEGVGRVGHVTPKLPKDGDEAFLYRKCNRRCLCCSIPYDGPAADPPTLHPSLGLSS